MTGGSHPSGSPPQVQGNSVLGSTAADLLLGERLALLLAGAEGARISAVALRAHLQDLLAGDTALLAPLQDLLQRPLFRSLLAEESPATRLACRDALLEDLSSTYQPAISSRLAVVIAGFLDGEDACLPTPVAATPAGSSALPVSRSPALHLLILVCAVLSGALVLSLGWILLGGRIPGSVPVVSIEPRPPSPTGTDPEGLMAWTPSESNGSWAGADRYKFARFPGGSFPESCAFSASDDRGQRVIDTGRIEYWACRSLGGSPGDGYRVQWADGAITTVRFRNGGGGTITGTEGESSSIRWRNSSHQGTAIVVIEHPDGGESWIPGRVHAPVP